MMRRILAAIAGMVVAGGVVGLIETAGHVAYPPPPGIDLSNLDALRALIGKLPMGALVFVVAAWILGAFTGSCVATWLARPPSIIPGLAVGAAILAATLYTVAIIPHPAWMVAAAVLLPLPSAWLGTAMFSR